MYEILKNVPKPETPARAAGSQAKYPWQGLEIGDCFFVPTTVKKFSSSCYSASKKYAPKVFRPYDGEIEGVKGVLDFREEDKH